jgi:hypothetical protein
MVVFVVFVPSTLEDRIILRFWVQDKTKSVLDLALHIQGGTYPPPMTLLSPLNTFVKLLTTMSARGSTLTFRKFPIVSSTTT